LSPLLAEAPAGLGVGIGEIVVSTERGVVITALGLGSCIGVVMMDPSAAVAGMAHVMLPESRAGATTPPGKFADTAVPALLAAVLDRGGRRERLVTKLAGGAQMFGGSGAGVLNIGERNAVAVHAALTGVGIRARATDTGGGFGRTVQVEVGAAAVIVRRVGAEPIQL